MTELVRDLGAVRDRAIHLLYQPIESVTVACGLWLATDRADYIVIDSAAPPTLRQHITLHEVAHILLGHQGGPAALGGLDLGLTTLDPAMVRRVLGRAPSTYGTPEERDAESLATYLGSQFVAPVADPPVPPDPAGAVLDRLVGALADDRRWHG